MKFEEVKKRAGVTRATMYVWGITANTTDADIAAKLRVQVANKRRVASDLVQQADNLEALAAELRGGDNE